MREHPPKGMGRIMSALVLCYHAVSEQWPAALSVHPQRLEAQLRWLRARGYRGVTFSEAVTAPPTAKILAVTFDDAYRSVLELALPILRRLELPGTVFAPTAFVGKDEPMAWEGIDRWLGGPHEAELTPMSWEQLAELAEAGWEVGSHTRSHPHLPTLSDAGLADELGRSKEDCTRRLGAPCRTLAYPYGDHDDRVVAATAAAGYEAACTLPSRLNEAGPLRWPRVGIYNADRDATFRLKVSPALRRARASRLAGQALRVRSSLKRAMRPT